MTDASIEHARQSIRSKGRGWDFRPAPRPEFAPSIVNAVLAVLAASLTLVEMTMGSFR